MRIQTGPLLAIAVFGLCLVPACAADESATSTILLADELKALSGHNAKDCGFFKIGDEPNQGWACAVAADKARRPFWLAFQESSIDSIVWIAVGRDSRGQRYYLTYDSSPYGRPGLHPRFTRDLCSADGVFDPERKDLGCGGHAP